MRRATGVESHEYDVCARTPRNHVGGLQRRGDRWCKRDAGRPLRHAGASVAHQDSCVVDDENQIRRGGAHEPSLPLGDTRRGKQRLARRGVDESDAIVRAQH